MIASAYRWVDGQGRPFSPRHRRPETAARWLARLPRRWAAYPVTLTREERLPSGRVRRSALLAEEKERAVYAAREAGLWRRPSLREAPGVRYLTRAQRALAARRQHSMGRLTARLRRAS